MLGKSLSGRNRMREIHQIDITVDLLGVIADIHGQVNALKVAIRCFHQLGVNQFILLGDVINYRPFGHQCTKILMNSPELLVGVKGNHDTLYLHEDYQEKQWEPITKEDMNWLHSLHDLVLIQSKVNFLMVHDFYDVANEGTFLRSLDLAAVLTGHFHYPSISFWNNIRVISIGGIIYGYFGILSFSKKEITIFQLDKKDIEKESLREDLEKIKKRMWYSLDQ